MLLKEMKYAVMQMVADAGNTVRLQGDTEEPNMYKATQTFCTLSRIGAVLVHGCYTTLSCATLKIDGQTSSWVGF